MSNFNVQKIKSNKFEDCEDAVLKITRKDNTQLNVEDIKEINKMVKNLLGKNKHNKFYIRIHGIQNSFTPKGYETELDIDEVQDYYGGKGKNNRKIL